MITFKLPEGFLLGTGSSAHQVEGAPYADGKGENIWDHEHRVNPTYFHNCSSTKEGAFFYDNYEKDIEDMKEQGLKSFRFSISWTRIFPRGYGEINQAGIDHYNKVIDCLLAAGIEPFVDVFHWDLPQALAECGGWKNRGIIEHFVNFARVCFENFGDRVKYWSTMNEPSVFTFAPYHWGSWPPFEEKVEGGVLAAYHAILCHYRTVRLYRSMNLGGKIGAVIDVVPMYPKDPSGKDVIGAQIQMERQCGWWLDPIFLGKYPELILKECEDFGCAMPEGYAEVMAREFAPVDMIGINYYFTGCVEYNEDLPEKSNRVENYYVQEGQRFELYPAGLYDAMMYVTRKYNRPEIYLTENGLGVLYDGDKEKEINDENRISYLREHLRMVVRSIEAGADIRGYYYWSNFDMFEGAAGYSYRFGLNFTDYETGERTRKKSWYYYQKLIKSGSVD